MDRTRKPTLNRAWPAVAAGTGAFIGMTSCMVTFMPLKGVGSPVAAVLIAIGIFKLLLRFGVPPEAEQLRTARVRTAALTAWGVSSLTSAYVAFEVASAIEAPSGSDIVPIGAFLGFLLGFPVFRGVLRIGLRDYRPAEERAAVPSRRWRVF